MISKSLESILASLRMHGPAADCETIAAVRDIDWNNIGDDNIDGCSEVVVLINAVIIFWSFEKDDQKRREIYALITQIYSKIYVSDLRIRSDEFEEYFEKYQIYMNDFQ